ncbi:MAG: 16S rRNA (cytidine(1402)-2'-O)-methyltransferase [Acidobacteriota bacterium]|nr:16S rRNA (cytidine(1402)-2'-O)-methyltransferase [Acidobacteriota bacterium]
MSGALYVVSTPIGNLEDLSPRARRVLDEVAIVACEDTRRTGRLLSRLGIKQRLVSLHEHNEQRRLPGLLESLDRGDDIALVSDAGTPLLSDPGYPLVRAAVQGGFNVVPVPGPSAAISALVASSLPPYPFTFAGFPPPKQSRRRRFFERFADLDHTLVLFEAPHRVLRCLADARAVLGDRESSVSRELTKIYEETLRGRLSDLEAELSSRPALKGEFCIVIGRAGTAASDSTA